MKLFKKREPIIIQSAESDGFAGLALIEDVEERMAAIKRLVDNAK